MSYRIYRYFGPFAHRDGPTLLHPHFVACENSVKRDGRGTTTINRIYLGETTRDLGDWCGVLAFPKDVHHAVMTAEQLRLLGDLCHNIAARVDGCNASDEREHIPAWLPVDVEEATP